MSRIHRIELNESQMSYIAELLRADAVNHPEHYAEDNVDFTYLAQCFETIIATPDDDYERRMMHGVTL